MASANALHVHMHYIDKVILLAYVKSSTYSLKVKILNYSSIFLRWSMASDLDSSRSIHVKGPQVGNEPNLRISKVNNSINSTHMIY